MVVHQLYSMVGDEHPLVLARVFSVLNNIFRFAMRMLVVHPLTGAPAPQPTPVLLKEMWDRLTLIRAAAQQRLVDPSTPSPVHVAIVRFLSTVVLALTHRSRHSRSLVAAAGSKTAAVVMTGPDAFTADDIPATHMLLHRAMLADAAGKTMTALVAVLSQPANQQAWTASTLAILVSTVARIATLRPATMQQVAGALASMVQYPAEAMRPTVSQAASPLAKRMHPTLSTAVRAALVRLMKSDAAASFAADLGACLTVMGDTIRPRALARAARVTIQPAVVQQLAATAPAPRPDPVAALPDLPQLHAGASYAARLGVEDDAGQDDDDPFAPPTAAIHEEAADAVPAEEGPVAVSDPRIAAGGSDWRGTGQTGVSAFSGQLQRLDAGAAEDFAEHCFERMVSQSRMEGIEHCGHAGALLLWQHAISWATDPTGQLVRDAVHAAAGQPATPDRLPAEAVSALIAKRVSLLTDAVCANVSVGADAGVLLATRVWAAAALGGAPPPELYGQVVQRLLRAVATCVVADGTGTGSDGASGLSTDGAKTFFLDVALALPSLPVDALADALCLLLWSEQATAATAGFHALAKLRKLRPRLAERLLHLALCAAHTAPERSAKKAAKEVLAAAAAGAPSRAATLQFAASAALSLTLPLAPAGAGAAGEPERLHLPLAPAPDFTPTEQEAAARSALEGPIRDIADAKRRLGPFMLLCLHTPALLRLLPVLYISAGGLRGSAPSQLPPMADHLRAAIITQAGRMIEALSKKKGPTFVLEHVLASQPCGGTASPWQVDAELALPCPAWLKDTELPKPAIPSAIAAVAEMVVCQTAVASPPPDAPRHMPGTRLHSDAAALAPPDLVATIARQVPAHGVAVMRPLLPFLPPADVLAFLPCFLAEADAGASTVQLLLRPPALPTAARPACPLDRGVLLAWLFAATTADFPASLTCRPPMPLATPPGTGATMPTPVLTLQHIASSAAASTVYQSAGKPPYALQRDVVQAIVAPLLANPAAFNGPSVSAALLAFSRLQPVPTFILVECLHALEGHTTDRMKYEVSCILSELFRASQRPGAWDPTAPQGAAAGEALISPPMWEKEDIWKGVPHVVVRTIPECFQALLLLPAPVLDTLLSGDAMAVLKQRLVSFAQNAANQELISDSMLDFLGVPLAIDRAAQKAQRESSAGVTAAATAALQQQQEKALAAAHERRQADAAARASRKRARPQHPQGKAGGRPRYK